MGDSATPTVASPTDAAPDVDARTSAEGEPAATTDEQEQKGLYPPRHPGRSQRMIGEVVVDLGLADRETVEEARSLPPAPRAGRRASCSSSAASCATTSSRASSPSASAWTSSTWPPTTSTWAPST